MNKIAGFMLLTFLVAVEAQAKSPWEGVWIFDRYSHATGGTLKIENCKEDSCEFDLGTYNGAHICSFGGEIKIKGNTAEHRESTDFSEDGTDQEAVINFKLDEQKNIITVEGNNNCRYFCGMHGYFEGEYENEKNPMRYETGFDCWAKDLTDTEKTICSDEQLAQADKEISEKYRDVMPFGWKEERDECKADVDCLWDFYSDYVRYGYERVADKALNLYEYMGNLEKNKFFTPTDFTLIDKYLRENIEKQDYEDWIHTFGTMVSDDCHNCYFLTYGLAGLFTIEESAFYINKDEIWLAFLHNDYDNDKNNYIVMYTPEGKTEKDIPEEYKDWLDRLKPHFPNGIKFKYFKSSLNESQATKVARRFIDTVKTNDPKLIANYVVFPFRRPNPLPNIKDEADFIKKYDMLFDAKVKDLILKSNPEDWKEMGYEGIMLGAGDVWLNNEGKLIAINIESAKEEAYIEKWYNDDRKKIYKDLREYKENVYTFKTENQIGRIDDMGDGYRLALWSKNSDMKTKPDVIVLNGSYEIQGSAGNIIYTFKNGGKEYNFFETHLSYDSPPYELEIYENGKLVSNKEAFNLKDE